MPARLHHERIARSEAAPARWLLLTHGIFGAGSNWRGIARKVHEQRPEWGIVLVDLRLHGRSQSGEPPHTVAACADDLRALIAELGGVDAIAGHSFGGKVVLATRPLVAARQTWVLDASPVPRPDLLANGSVTRVLDLLERLPKQWAHRDDFVAAVVADGHDSGLAQWLAMNVVPDRDAYVFRLDTSALRALLVDYHALDLWNVLVAPGGTVEVVLADRSEAVDAATRTRLEAAPSHLRVHHVDAGHWLHIDSPAEIIALFAHYLETADPRHGE